MFKSTLIIPSNAAYYLNFFESLFLRFLEATGASKKTQENYRTDIRHFVVWLVTDLGVQGIPKPQPEYRLVEVVNEETIARFKANLSSGGTPDATVNRRLSSLRVFMKFCQDNGWIQENPTETVRNIPKVKSRDKELETTIREFRKSLLAEGMSQLIADDSCNEVREFLRWINQNS